MHEVLEKMKQFKLKIHSDDFSDQLLVFNASEFPDVNLNDLLKINHCNSNVSNFILVQVKSLKGEINKGAISIKKRLATCFNFQVFQDVNVMKVEPEDVTVDLLEVSFKDQYISRSDMLRMKKHLLNSCVYIDHPVEFSDIRAQVSEMWANSVKVKCGFISDHTNFVLRSFTAKVYLFIQMSAEMWEYDAYGYLQFERAVNGFLKALFTKWKEKKCCHELTLVLFSRTFYDTKFLNDFPPDIREVVRKNYNGQYYLDFYKCVVQTERMDDCTPLIKTLKKLFYKYQSFTEIPGCPPGKNSAASEGNFLEAINMSLNVFDRHYVDRNLDRTGQIVVCITPGVGVFDVDRDLTILTKERMIDNGIGSDLICLGQQPLHAVPLFKFHHSTSTGGSSTDLGLMKSTLPVQDFNIPHWINHSFYAINPFSDKGTTNINYIPRIHVAKKKKKSERKISASFVAKPKRVSKESDSDLPSLQQPNYAEFDKQVFGFPRLSDTWKQLANDSTLLQKTSTARETIVKRPSKFSEEWPPAAKQKSFEMRYSPDTGSLASQTQPSRPVFIPLSKPHRLAHVQQSQGGLASSVGMTANLEKYYQTETNLSAEPQPVVGSANLPQNLLKDPSNKALQRRALFNPFNPSHMFAPLTANRRRWVHTYPRGPQGEALVLHHQNPLTRSISRSRQTSESADDESVVASVGFSPSRNSPSTNSSFHSHIVMKPGSVDSGSGSASSSPSPARNIKHLMGNESISWSLNPNPAEQGAKGLDWKSLKCPACLPITTDYHPTYAHLRNACTEQSYFLVPDDGDICNEDEDEVLRTKSEQPSLEIRSSKEVFQELINQRLCQGFQIIKQTNRMRTNDSSSSVVTVISPNNSEVSFISQLCGTSPMFSSPRGLDELKSSPYSCMLSHGRQYHFVRFVQDDDKIEVIIFKPRHPFDTVTVEYSYMLWPKTRGQFQPSRCSFAHEKVEDYQWNHHDNYVCCVDSELQMAIGLKCWKAKYVVLPNPTKRLQALKRCTETGQVRYDSFDGCHCDKSHESNFEGGECGVMTEGFIRFLEHINKIRRPNSQAFRKSWKSFANFSPSLSKSYTSLSAFTQNSSVSNHATPTPPARPTSDTPTSDRSTPTSQQLNDSFAPISTITTKLSHSVDARPVAVKTTRTDKHGDGKQQGEPRRHSLTCNSELTDILAALSHPETGLSFLSESYGFPSKTFVSLEAVHWALANVGGLESIKDACRLFETMCNYSLINHASGNMTHGFVYGYVFYSMKDEQQNDLEDPTSYQYMSTFSNTYNSRWFEVAIKRWELYNRSSGDKTPFGNRETSSEGKSGAFYVTANRESPRADRTFPAKQTVRIPLVNKQRTNRTEWAEVRYSTGVRAGADSFIFSFEMQWLVATASCVSSMLQLWYRKATSNCDLYLFPVPSDPFSFPRSGAGGPLRSPLFVPLNVKALLDTKSEFKDLSKNVAWYRDTMISFMEAILRRFGFARDDSGSQNLDPSARYTVSQNYIHCTGQAFAQIPLHNRAVQRHSISLRQRAHSTRRLPLQDDGRDSPSNVLGFISQSELDSTGFYWSTNYMQTKRWRLSVLDDFPVQDIEQDFVRFCANSEDRLNDFFSCFLSEYVAKN